MRDSTIGLTAPYFSFIYSLFWHWHSHFSCSLQRYSPCSLFIPIFCVHFWRSHILCTLDRLFQILCSLKTSSHFSCSLNYHEKKLCLLSNNDIFPLQVRWVEAGSGRAPRRLPWATPPQYLRPPQGPRGAQVGVGDPRNSNSSSSWLPCRELHCRLPRSTQL